MIDDILYQDTRDFIIEIPISEVVSRPESISFDGSNYTYDIMLETINIF